MSNHLRVLLVLIGFALLAPATSPAQECAVGCASQLKACVRNGRTSSFTCKLSCLTNPPAEGRRACVKACADVARTARSGCGSSLDNCVNTCAPAAGTPDQHSCLAPCGASLRDCAGTAVANTRACLEPCRDAADRLGCLSDCVSAAQASATACASNLSTCASDCGVTPPGIPTGTTTVTDGACDAQCGIDLTHCLATASQSVFSCGASCFVSLNPFQCLLGCKDSAVTGAAACRSTAESCHTACAQ